MRHSGSKCLVNKPHLLGFGTIDLEEGNTGKQTVEIAEAGFLGIKLHPAYQQFHVLDDRLTELYSVAEDYATASIDTVRRKLVSF